eukprot:Gb_28823 [translate_table: standard]
MNFMKRGDYYGVFCMQYWLDKVKETRKILEASSVELDARNADDSKKDFGDADSPNDNKEGKERKKAQKEECKQKEQEEKERLEREKEETRRRKLEERARIERKEEEATRIKEEEQKLAKRRKEEDRRRSDKRHRERREDDGEELKKHEERRERKYEDEIESDDDRRNIGKALRSMKRERIGSMKMTVTVIIQNAKIDMFKGTMRLDVDKWGRVEVVALANFIVKEDYNLFFRGIRVGQC